jgi:hypothetical protein
MADQAEIDAVLDMLGTSAVDSGWDAGKIGALLDAGESPKIARRYWESRMASTSELADVSESGSSRRLSQIHTSAAAMAAYYRGAETSEDPENAPGNPSFSREIRRV